MIFKNSSDVMMTSFIRPVGEVRSKEETDQMRPEGQVSIGGKLWLSETELRGKLTIGGRVG